MKSLFEELGGTYMQQGAYLLPNLTLPEQEDRPINIWGSGGENFSRAATK